MLSAVRTSTRILCELPHRYQYLRIANASDAHRTECLAALDVLRGMDGVSTCAQILIEYWVGATRPTEANGLGLDTSRTARNLRLMTRLFPCVPEPANISEVWQEIVICHDVKGKQAHDARIAALMIAHGITHILTLNPDDFARYPEITALTPRQIA